MFDGWIERKRKGAPCPPCTVDPANVELLEMAHDIMLEFRRDPKILQMVGKAVGIMAHNERTRALLPQAELMEIMLMSMLAHQRDSEMISCLLWALVIMCRPVGCRGRGSITGRGCSLRQRTHIKEQRWY